MRAAAAFAAFALLLGCASMDVAYDEQRDFSHYRTWAWLSRTTRTVDVPAGRERLLDRLGATAVVESLAGQGLVATEGDADLLVTYVLEVRQQLVRVNETLAPNILSSLHSSPSIVVQATEQRIDVYHEGRLRIVLTDRRQQRVVWEGELRDRYKQGIASHLEGSIARLLARVPAEADAPRADEEAEATDPAS